MTDARNQTPPRQLTRSRSSAGIITPLSLTLTPAGRAVPGTSRRTRTMASSVRSQAAFQAGDRSGKRQRCCTSAESEAHAADLPDGLTCVVGIVPTASQPIRATIAIPRMSAALPPSTRSTVKIATGTRNTRKKAWAAHCGHGGLATASTAAATSGGPILRTSTNGQVAGALRPESCGSDWRPPAGRSPDMQRTPCGE